MIKKVLYFLPTILLVTISIFQSIYTKTQEEIVVRVLDGDTIDLENGDRIRLLGIDAPEIGEPFSQEAKLTLEDMLLGKHVTIEKDVLWNKDKYGRLLRYVFLDEKLINCEMVRLGLAKNLADEASKYYNCFLKAEEEAREKKVGIWSSS
jgi:micrococcal nuclease